MIGIRKTPSLQRRCLQDKSGTGAIEFALLAPLFILLLLGMAAYGIYFGASHSIQQIAADAARTAIAGLNAGERQTLVTHFIDNNASGYPFVDIRRLTFAANDNPSDSNQFVVSITYDASSLPIWNLLRDLPMPGMTISRKATIRIGGI
jgi:Flp pilus assembly protein TadG